MGPRRLGGVVVNTLHEGAPSYAPTTPRPRLTFAALSKIVDAAAPLASNDVERALVKTAREELLFHRAGQHGYADYDRVARACLALEQIATRPAVRVAPRVTFIESRTVSGRFYRVVGSECSCEAGKRGVGCWHVAAAKRGE